MSDMSLDRIRSAAAKIWFDRFDIAGFARFFHDRYPIKTAQNIAFETGFPADTVKKWLIGECIPGGRALVALLCVYGPDLVHAMLHDMPPWMSAASRAERSSLLEREIAQRLGELDHLAKGDP